MICFTLFSHHCMLQECVWVNFFVPNLVSTEVSAALTMLLTTINTLCISDKAETQHLLNAPDYLFVSTRVASAFPQLVESIIVRSFETYSPGQLARKWRFGVTDSWSASVCDSSSSILTAIAVGLAAVLFAALQTFGASPFVLQRVTIRLAQPWALTGLTLFIYYITKTILGVVIFSVVIMAAIVAFCWRHWLHGRSRVAKLAVAPHFVDSDEDEDDDYDEDDEDDEDDEVVDDAVAEKDDEDDKPHKKHDSRTDGDNASVAIKPDCASSKKKEEGVKDELASSAEASNPSSHNGAAALCRLRGLISESSIVEDKDSDNGQCKDDDEVDDCDNGKQEVGDDNEEQEDDDDLELNSSVSAALRGSSSFSASLSLSWSSGESSERDPQQVDSSDSSDSSEPSHATPH